MEWFINVSSCHSNANLSLGKSYTVSLKPNYLLSASSTDVTSLTDGKYSSGYFWTEKSTVGWQGAKRVEILIDLDNISTIGSVSFHTARGTSGGVHFPSRIAVFVGPDQKSFVYAGDAAHDGDSDEPKYEVKSLVLGNVGIRGRYVLLEIDLNGYYLFCDEIEVLEGVKDSGRSGNFTLDDARKHAQQIARVDVEKELVRKTLAELRQSGANLPELPERFSKLDSKLTKATAMPEMAALEADLRTLRQEQLHARFPDTRLLIEPVVPWGHIAVYPSVSGSMPLSFAFAMPRNGYDHAAFMLTNPTPESLQVRILLPPADAGAPDLSLFEAKFVDTAALESIADPLLPIVGPLELLPGESKVLFLSAHGAQPGTWRGEMVIVADKFRRTIAINSQVAAQELPQRLSLNSVNWGYFDFPLIGNRVPSAVEDQLSHHTNVLVVPPRHLPLHPFDRPADFGNLKRYLERSRRADKILIFMGNRLKTAHSSPASGEFLYQTWKAGFRLWYEKLLKTVVELGYRADQLYLYPYDEMRGDERDQFLAFAHWAKSEIPGIRFYATINEAAALNALPYLDVAQVINNDELLDAVKSSNAEIWIYACSARAKSLSPYAYYRLMAWKAFVRGYMGIGFWAYADAGWTDNYGSAWDDFDGEYPDYAVIYEGEGGAIISSRRWEAWRMGIEDYELLTMYASKKGEVVAKALAREVVDNPADTGRADRIRRHIFEELAKE